MGIPINSGGGSRRPPAIALRAINNYVDVAVINEEKIPAYEYGKPGEVKTTRDGKPKTQDAVTVLVIRGDGVINDNGADRPVQPGEVATIYFEGQSRWDPDLDKSRENGAFKSWSGAKEDLGQLMVGDVFRWMFEAEIPGKGTQPRKLRPVKIRHPKPEEAEQTARCEQLHREGTAIPVGVGAGPADDPF
jgi:hypothetical protein